MSKTLYCTLAPMLLFVYPVASAQQENSAPATQAEVEMLRQEVAELRSEIRALRAKGESTAAPASTSDAPSPVVAQLDQPSTTPKQNLLQDATLNLTFDGYYGFNFNRPIGRVNLLRAYDVNANNFSINQATLLFERAPDPDKGRRWGARVDLQYGQATETLQGSPVNEPRAQVYRPLFQAYGTHVVPVGKGLTVDFGKFASSLGLEGNYTKDQFNYSRAFWFNFLPFYHMGVRTSYPINDKVKLSYWIVNGTQQTESFNDFKDQFFGLTLTPNKSVTWNVNYYLGQEHPDVVQILNVGLPATPGAQPGQSITPVIHAHTGKLHIFDTYATWQANPRWTLAAEADYVLQRDAAHSSPMIDEGGAMYARYQLTNRAALALRGEYLYDRRGAFSGIDQALKEITATYDLKLADGFILRPEYRRDFSDKPFFLTSRAGVLKREQNTATIGLVWWWGGKEGSW